MISDLYFSGHYRVTEERESSLKKVLKFLDENKLFCIMIPTTRKVGYKVNLNDERLNGEIRNCIMMCSESFISTIEKKSVRLRFISTENVNEELKLMISRKVSEANNTYQIWISKALTVKGLWLQQLMRKFVSSVPKVNSMTLTDDSSKISIKNCIDPENVVIDFKRLKSKRGLNW